MYVITIKEMKLIQIKLIKQPMSKALVGKMRINKNIPMHVSIVTWST